MPPPTPVSERAHDSIPQGSQFQLVRRVEADVAQHGVSVLCSQQKGDGDDIGGSEGKGGVRMTTEELMRRVKERLNRTSNPELPADETMKAILALGNERDAEKERANRLSSDIDAVRQSLSDSETTAEGWKKKYLAERNRANEQAFVAHELGQFVEETANRMHVGNEPVVARRIWDLNRSMIVRKPLNCHLYDTEEDAQDAYYRFCKSGAFKPTDKGFLRFLFSEVEK